MSADGGETDGAGLGPRLVLLLACACGAAAANLYYAQPLLSTLARALHVSDGTAGLLVTASQAGYVIGLSLIVPLGDLIERRRLITVMAAVTGLLEFVAAGSPSFPTLAAALLMIGISSALAQVIVPMSSHLAAADERGRAVGTVMSGLLIGILLARTISGLVAGALGWRAVFAVAGAVMLTLAMALRRSLPTVTPTSQMRYRDALRSVFSLVAREPVLRQRMLLGVLGFGTFGVLWTSLAFLLAGPPYRFGSATIGLFGLAGAAGAAIAPVAGRMADRGQGRRAVSFALTMLICGWGLLALGSSSLAALIGGIVVLDLGAQSLHTSNQSRIYALTAEARSRVTTAYVAAGFCGGAVCSALSATLYASGGWGAVCALGAATSTMAMCVWLVSERVMATVGAPPVVCPAPITPNPRRSP